MTVFVLLVVVAALLTLESGLRGKVPLWVPLFFVCVALLIRHVPGLR